MRFKRSPASGIILILFFTITLIVILAGFLYYNYQKKNLLTEKQIELSAISDLKIRQISQWRLDRIGHGRFLSENIILLKKITEYLRSPNDLHLKDDILQSLKSLTENFDFNGVLLLDTLGKVRINFPEGDTVVSDYLKQVLPAAIKLKYGLLTDLHKTNPESPVQLNLIVPLIDKDKKEGHVLSLLSLSINPQEVLYPLIQSWPTPSKSAETLIVRKDGDEIVYLNELRHVQNSKLTLRRAVTTRKLAAAMAMEGITGTIDAVDYRNVPVVAAMNKIPGTPWYMIAKMDRKEILSALNWEVSMIILIIGLVIIATGSFLAFIVRNQRAAFYRERYENELDRLALVKHFDYILKYANDIILLIDTDLNIIEANDRALETYQYTREEFIGMKLDKIRAPETLSQLQEDLNNVNMNKSATFETIHKRRDNSTFPVEVSSRVVTMEGSEYYQTITRDITDRKSVENTLKESENRFRKIFEESPFAMLISGIDFSILQANLSFRDFIGYTEEELKSLTFKDFTHSDYVGGDEISLLNLVAGKIPVYHTEKKYIRKDGSLVWGSTTVSIIRNNEGEAKFFLVMIKDITSQKKATEELVIAKEKAEESDRLKTAFLHNVSHEIRTPMNAIIGFSTLLNEPDVTDEERHQYIDIIFQSGSQLLSIINDIVDIANFESGQTKVNLTKINLNSKLKSLSEQFRIAAKQNDTSINLDMSLNDEDSSIVTDSTKLVQILSNLINNAVKFTRNGQIDFGYRLKDKILEFFVKDTGIGIQPEYHSRIFDRFFQVDSAVSRRYSGTGLGLSICKGYVELLGGTIKVESEPDKGTLFVFTIPYFHA
jgi:PAS domain S-box-containing protein